MTDLFEADNTQDQDVVVKVEDLVGEGKKFKSVEDLAKGKVMSDRFIEQLKQEAEDLRNELKTRITLEEFMTKVNTPATTQNTDPAHNQNPASEKPTSAMTPEQLEQLLDKKLQERESANVQRQNLNAVKQRLQEAYGPNYVTTLDEKAKSLGLSRDFFNNLAATQPNALFAMLGVDRQKRQEPGLFTPPPSSASISSRSNTPVDRTEAFYNNLKKTNPTEYWSASTQAQMHRDAIRLGEKFFSS